MAATVIGLSVLAFVAVLLAGLAGVQTSSGVWPVIVLLPLVGLPIGFLLMVALIVLNAVKRARQARPRR
jgi:heme A synthase